LDAAASTLESRAQGNTKALWDGLGGEGPEGWEQGEEGCGPCEEEAPTLNGKKIVKPDHAAAFSALLFGLPTEGGQRYPWRRQVGQALSLVLFSSIFT